MYAHKWDSISQIIYWENSIDIITTYILSTLNKQLTVFY